MPPANDTGSSLHRPLPLRKRPDLVVREHKYRGRPYRVVKEPVGMKYHRFREDEYALLELLDGKRSLAEIKEEFERRYAPAKITYRELQQFLGTLHRGGLLLSDLAGQGEQLWLRGFETRRKQTVSTLMNILAWRFRGIDPEWLLDALYPWTRWFFTWTMLVVAAVLGLSALVLVAVNYDQFSAKLPTFQQFFGPQNWIYLGVTLAVVKVLHEFGHGLSCKHFGGECHELGAMLLVFTPALYCNVTDSWLLESKWKRMAIGAAGIYVELLLASIATWLWFYSAPGLLNQICLSVMFICSVSTVVFNGNPLLRFDGYYILSDYLEIPNLSQKSTETLQRWFYRYCLGLEQPDDPHLSTWGQCIVVTYAVLAFLYRLVVMFGILLFLSNLLEPYGLKVLARALTIAGAAGMAFQPVWQIIKYFRVPGRIGEVKPARLALTLATVVALVAGVLFVPLPHHVRCPLEVRPRDAAMVFVAEPGALHEVLAEPGAEVQRDAPVAKLRSLDLEIALTDLRTRLDDLERQTRNLERERYTSPEAGLKLPALRQEAASLKEQVAEKLQAQQMLVLKAPRAGVVYPPPARPSVKASPAGEETRLGGWSGTPFDERNREAFFRKGELFCLVGDPRSLEATLVIDQTDRNLVRVGQKVRVLLDSHPHASIECEIREIAEIDLKYAPPSLSQHRGGQLVTKADAQGGERLVSAAYQARVPLPPDALDYQVGARGRAKIYSGWQPLGWRVWRFLARTFYFEL